MEKPFRVSVLCCYTIVISLLYLTSDSIFFKRFEFMAYDTLMRLRPSLTTSDQIVMIGIDEKSLQALGAWPWTRDVYALMIQKLNHWGKPRVIGLDLFFSQEDAATDFFFIQALKQNRNVILPLAFEMNNAKDVSLPSADILGYASSHEELSTIEDFSLDPGGLENLHPISAPFAIKPHYSIYQNVSGAGHVNIEPDIDGTIRRVALWLDFKGKWIPHFSLALLARYLGKPVQIEDASMFPMDIQGRVLVNWAAPWSQSFTYYSFVDVMQAIEDRQQDKKPALHLEKIFGDKICLIGVTATGLVDIKATPLDNVYPMVGLHANMINSAFQKESIHCPSPLWINFWQLLMMLLSMPFILALRKRNGIFWVLSLIVLWLLLNYFIFYFKGIFIPPITPVLGTILCLLFALALSQAFNLLEIRKLLVQATTDELTGLYTFRFFKFKLQELFSRFIGESKPFSLIILDVDNFKKVNDTYGHEAGNIVLKGIAECLRGLTEYSSILNARYGGEEFCVLLPNTSKEQAMIYANQILKSLNKYRHHIGEGNILQVTASIGVASMPPTLCDIPQQFIQAADSAMYVAKRSGKNQVSYFKKEFIKFSPDFSHMNIEECPSNLSGNKQGLDYLSLDLKARTSELENTITQLKKIQMELIHHEKKAEAYRLTSFISHELNKPLHNIQNCLEIIQKDGQDLPRVKRFGSLAMDEMERLIQLSRQIHNFNKPPSYVEKQFSLHQMLDDILTLMEKSLQDQGIEIFKFFSQQPLQFTGQEEEFKQVILNLVSNAKDAMKQGGKLTVKTIRNENHFLIQIKDTGQGIAPEVQVNLFKPFYTTKGEQGSGLGLAVCQQILKKYEGEIKVDTYMGAGTCFEIKLPNIQTSLNSGELKI